MNKIEELIQQLCPDGVKFTEIGKIGDFYGGLTGKNKNDFQAGNAKFITYMNVFSNICVKTDIDTFVKIGEKENQNRVEYGDVLFTGSSETPDECGMSSVLTEKVTEPLYLNSFCFGFRLHDKELFLPDFLKYLFRDDSIRKQIGQTASGVTRFNISKKRFATVIIPIPPLAVQQEIAYILDKFTQLEAELETELEARKKQYKYYRNELLNFEGKEVEWKTMGEVCRLKAGKSIKADKISTSINDERKYPCIGGNGIRGYVENYSHNGNFSIIGRQGALCGNINFISGKFYATEHAVIVDNLGSFDVRFLFHYLYIMNLNQYASAGAQPGLAVSNIEKLLIPIPPRAEQQRIVEILDKFDALVNDISVGFPAEIATRKKQYKYYRGKLLDFKNINDG